MSELMSESTPKWWMCDGCGAWQRTSDPCHECRWTRMLSHHASHTGPLPQSFQFRFLIDLEYRSSGEFFFVELTSERLPLISDDVMVKEELWTTVATRLEAGRIPTKSDWKELELIATDVLHCALAKSLSEHWLGEPKQTAQEKESSLRLPIQIRFRVSVLDPGASDWPSPGDWLEVVALNKALKRSGKLLEDTDVELTLVSPIGMVRETDRLHVVVSRSRLEFMKLGVEVRGNEKLLWKETSAAFIPRDVSSSVIDQRLPAAFLWQIAGAIDKGLKKSSKSLPTNDFRLDGVEAAIRVAGREKSLHVPIRCHHFGAKRLGTDAYIDFGSTQTKVVLKTDGQSPEPITIATDSYTRKLGVSEYDKFAFLSDETGRAWMEWMAQFIPALRWHIAEKRTSFLRRVVVSLPDSGALSLERLATKVNDAKQRVEPLRQVASFELAPPHDLRVISEHEVLYHHYSGPIQALVALSKKYNQRYESLLAQHGERRQAYKKHEERAFGLYKHFVDGPQNPGRFTGKAPDQWMIELLSSPEVWSRCIIFDAGGLSLDMAVLEHGRLNERMSKSSQKCGAEELSMKMAQARNGSSKSSLWTKEKARLGLAWNQAHETVASIKERIEITGGTHQRVYRDLTRALYSHDVNEVVRGCATRWRGQKEGACLVVLTGGGAMNPHFFDLVSEVCARSNLTPHLHSGDSLSSLLELARKSPIAFNGLESNAVDTFLETQEWGRLKGAREMSYDKFAVVGGLMSQGKE